MFLEVNMHSQQFLVQEFLWVIKIANKNHF